MPGFVKMEMEDRLAIVTVNRPDALNALNSTVLRELSMAIEHLSMAADVGAIDIEGASVVYFIDVSLVERAWRLLHSALLTQARQQSLSNKIDCSQYHGSSLL